MQVNHNLDLGLACTELRLRVRAAQLTQEQIAAALGVSQAQVSRVLAGKLERRSKLFEAISVYVRSAGGRSGKAAAIRNGVLQDALIETWDGTQAHAQALAVVIRAMGVLSPLAVGSPGRRPKRSA
jgi:transcriptional regulator with XRE-family HTH domain